jgi:hypothetical protein
MDEDAAVTPQQAREAAYRFIARYYDHERVAPILRVLEAISSTGDPPEADGSWAEWLTCIRETLDGAPLPEVPRPWDA